MPLLSPSATGCPHVAYVMSCLLVLPTNTVPPTLMASHNRRPHGLLLVLVRHLAVPDHQDYDKIVVMAAGHVGEMGSPGDLLRAAAAAQASPDGLQPDTQDGGAGLFAGMVDAGGPAVSARLRRRVDAAEAAQASRGVAAE